MRILLVNKYTRVTGGADRHCLDLAGMLSARGHSVRFLSFKGGRSDELGGAFVTPTVMHETRDRLSTAERMAVATHAVWNRSAAAATRRLISDFRPDVVQAHKLYPQLSVAPVVVAHAAGVPVVQWAHDYEFVAAHPEDDRGSRLDRFESTGTYRALNTATFVVRRLVHVPRVSHWLVASRFARSVYARHGIDCDVVELFQPRTDEPPYHKIPRNMPLQRCNRLPRRQDRRRNRWRSTDTPWHDCYDPFSKLVGTIPFPLVRRLVGTRSDEDRR